VVATMAMLQAAFMRCRNIFATVGTQERAPNFAGYLLSCRQIGSDW
jgi:hypothetical protein